MASTNDILEEIKKLTHSPTLKVVSDFKYLVGGAAGALDVISESASVGAPWDFNGCAKANGGSGYITKLHALLQTTNLTPRLSLFLFTQKPTSTLQDNAPNTAPIIGDILFYVGRVDLPAMSDIGTGMSESVATPSTVGNLPLAFTCAPDSTRLYGIVVISDDLTPGALDRLSMNLTIEQY